MATWLRGHLATWPPCDLATWPPDLPTHSHFHLLCSLPFTNPAYIPPLSLFLSLDPHPLQIGEAAGAPIVRYPENLTLTNLVFFMAAPTLCYQVRGGGDTGVEGGGERWRQGYREAGREGAGI